MGKNIKHEVPFLLDFVCSSVAGVCEEGSGNNIAACVDGGSNQGSCRSGTGNTAGACGTGDSPDQPCFSTGSGNTAQACATGDTPGAGECGSGITH